MDEDLTPSYSELKSDQNEGSMIMSFDQTKDVLNQARKFHHRLSEFYEELKESASRERTRALLDYMSRHEQYLDDCLAEFQGEVDKNVLDAYFQYGSDASNLSGISNFEIKDEMDVEDVVAAAMHFDACLIRFYREIAQKARTPKVREVFENLLVMEEHEQIELSKTTLELGLVKAPSA
jgi:rubrerythrin